MKKYVCYYRVSTKKQGLGLEAQQTICRDFVKSHRGEIIAEFSEKESGKRDDRPEMLKAINLANSSDATFVVAKIDRLSRGGLFAAAGILEKINNIAVVGLPDLNTLTKGLFLSLAAYERELISERTKQALAAKKAQGAKLGAPSATFTDKQRSAAIERRRINAADNCKQYLDLIAMYREKGMTLQEIADKLNSKGFTTARGKAFAPATIAMYLKRTEK